MKREKAGSETVASKEELFKEMFSQKKEITKKDSSVSAAIKIKRKKYVPKH